VNDAPCALNKEQIDRFHREGYLVAEEVFGDADLQPVVDELSETVNQRAQALVGRGELNRTYASKGFEGQLAAISQETDKLALSIWNGVLSGAGIFGLITHPRLIDIAEQFCGPEVVASSVYRLRPKIPNYGYGAVPWHQDSSYFEPYCDDALVLTAWVPLVNATKENGCLWVIPGSHHSPVVPHRLHSSGKYLEIEKDDLPPGDQVACKVPKGGVLFMTNRTVHGSFENTTECVRWSMDLRYQSAALPTNANVTRLEGEVQANIEAGVPAACYPPEADFLVRSRVRPREVIATAKAFNTLRATHQGQEVTNRWGVTWAAPQDTGS
jgi:phytanoyl-CoA hydroxylase